MGWNVNCSFAGHQRAEAVKISSVPDVGTPVNQSVFLLKTSELLLLLIILLQRPLFQFSSNEASGSLKAEKRINNFRGT